MKVVYHPKVPNESRDILDYYADLSDALGDKFWKELTLDIEYARKYPERHHYDQLGVGLRRKNMVNFPVHFLFRVFSSHIRITTVRHNRSSPTHGLRRK